MESQASRERINAWYTIRFEEMLMDFCAVTRSLVPATVSDIELRRRFHGVLMGIIAFTLSEGPERGVMIELGAVVAGLGNASPESLTRIRTAFERVLTQDLPPEYLAVIQDRLAAMLTCFSWGYVERTMHDSHAGSHPSPALLAPPPGGVGFYEQLFLQHPRAMFLIDTEVGAPIAFNPAFHQMFGFTLEEELALTPEEMRTEDTPEDDYDLLADMFAGRIPYITRESAKRHKDGRSIRYRMLGWPIRDEQGEIRALAQLLTPLDDDPAAETRATAAQKRIRFLMQLSADPIIVVDGDGMIRSASPSTESVLGHDPDTLIGCHAVDLLADGQRERLDALIADLVVLPRATATKEFQFLRRDGVIRWFEVAGTNMLDVAEVHGIALQARDVSERKRMEELLAYQALLDPLTGLLNRRGIVAEIDGALARGRDPEARPSVAFIDLDNFKEINDTFGHQVGDEVLVAIGERIRGALGAAGHAARLGGDEFVVLVDDATEAEAAQLFAHILEKVSASIEIVGTTRAIHASIGIARSGGDGETTTSLLHAADVALYAMKLGRAGSMIRTWVTD